MQFLLDNTKIFLLTVLSCSLLILATWYGGVIEVNNLAAKRIVISEQTNVNAETSAVSSPDPSSLVMSPINKEDSDEDTDKSNSIWDSMSRDFKLDHKAQSPRVQAEIRKLLADQAKLQQILKAAAPYIYYIYQQTQARGLPAEIALIPFVESEFNPNDHSKKGAAGLWQLMPETAHELGVKVGSHYDGRRNLIASTKAALAYFNDLGNTFKGDWYLAIAAYDCGQGKVESVSRRTGSQSYWNLPLPKETKAYVPKLLAVAAIVKNPEKYGVELPPIDNEPYFTQVNVKKATNLADVAKNSGVDIATLHALNPDYKHGIVPNKGNYTVLVPEKT